MRNPTGYLIKANEPFRGNTQSILYLDGEGVERVAYTGRCRVMQGNHVMSEGSPDLTLAEYEAERGQTFKRITWEELEMLLEAHYSSLKTKPEEITAERYDYMLEVLPPCRWQNIGGASIFHVSERLTANIVQWCFSLRGKYYAFHDDASLSNEKLHAIIGSV
jgi:hypothetical protein